MIEPVLSELPPPRHTEINLSPVNQRPKYYSAKNAEMSNGIGPAKNAEMSNGIEPIFFTDNQCVSLIYANRVYICDPYTMYAGEIAPTAIYNYLIEALKGNVKYRFINICEYSIIMQILPNSGRQVINTYFNNILSLYHAYINTRREKEYTIKKLVKRAYKLEQEIFGDSQQLITLSSEGSIDFIISSSENTLHIQKRGKETILIFADEDTIVRAINIGEAEFDADLINGTLVKKIIFSPNVVCVGSTKRGVELVFKGGYQIDDILALAKIFPFAIRITLRGAKYENFLPVLSSRFKYLIDVAVQN